MFSTGTVYANCMNCTFDYEVQAQYRVPVIVSGHGRSVTEVLTVNVRDRNEEHSIDNMDDTVYISTDKRQDEEVNLGEGGVKVRKKKRKERKKKGRDKERYMYADRWRQVERKQQI